MAKFIIMGCYTAKGLGGFVNNPDTDRKVALQQHFVKQLEQSLLPMLV